MRKKQKFTAIVKPALAAALSLAMAVSGIAVIPGAAHADDAEPVLSLDFERGLNWFHDTYGNDFDIVTSDTVIVKKVGDQVESGDKVDANGFVYTGDGKDAKYNKTSVSNQPGTVYDEETKSTAFLYGDTVQLPQLVKETSAAIAGDDAATAALDTSGGSGVGIGEVAREAMVCQSAVTLPNPLADKNPAAVTITYWAYVPADADKDLSLIAFEGTDAAAALYAANDSAAAAKGKWNQYAAVFGADGATFYVNGEAVEENFLKVSGTYDLSLISGGKLFLGSSAKLDLETLYGQKLDDVKFYTTALTADQIKAAYDAEAVIPVADVAKPDVVYSLSDMSQMTDITTVPTPEGTPTSLLRLWMIP